MNRIKNLFQQKNKNILSVFCTAGFPELESIVPILEELPNNGVDMVEIGMPFSDPTADGPLIQYSNNIAIQNGMMLKVLFEQLKGIRAKIHIPLVLMGYLNPALQYGFDDFLYLMCVSFIFLIFLIIFKCQSSSKYVWSNWS